MTPEEIYRTLIEHYGRPRWWSDDPYTVMFQAVLVQNTACDRLVDLPYSGFIKLVCGSLVACVASGVEFLDRRLELALSRLVAKRLRLVDEYALFSGFDVRHIQSPVF